MTIRGILKFSLIGFALQVLIHILVVIWGGAYLGECLFTLYLPWLKLGVFLFDPFLEGGGHALSLGGILGYLLGVLVYSLLLGAAICYFYEDRKMRTRI